ncbi:GNAT family N-acetyltransferase [Haloflavibacter putidus]|uniref:N-acetyltransferase n=1 Tax=Haloflavibacter putidus TaxID=2576776 RepID=A0A507ZRM0_9FLAO|nr:N-acetyltransferase [Haloflavibacter putidus]TQD39153.1 N-acetyltransferase [Haloflavibacter putidus]
MKTKDFEINDNAFLRQFEATIEDELVTLEYSEQERKIFLSKLTVAENLQEKGYQEIFLTKIFDYLAEKEKLKVVPTSKEVRKFFRKNKEKYSELLPIGINI